jgi:predicted DNA-binding protein (UPF0251 family)
MGPCPKASCYRPEGCPKKHNEEVELLPEEAEALRLKDVKELDQTTAAEKMGISQSSFQRILTSARKKISSALFGGKVIRIQKK